MNKKIVGLLITLAAVVTVGAGCASQQPTANNTSAAVPKPTITGFPYSFLDIKFGSPIELKIEDIGAEPATAYSAGIPNDAGGLKFRAAFTIISPDLQQAMENDKDRMINYAKTSLLGIAKAGNEKTNRTILGKSMEGTRQSSTIPAPSTTESYLVTLPSGRLLFVGFKYTEDMSKEEAEPIIAAITSSLQE